MDFMRHQAELDAVVPGLSASYDALRKSEGQGIYTSLGRYYNHTIFGRDAGMTAKFVSDFDHQTAWQTITTLARYQGMTTDEKTQQSPGKIHHEMRNYALWHGRWFDRLGLTIAGKLWGMRDETLVSYFAADTTATYIRLINKYVQHIDASVLERKVLVADESERSLGDSLAAAADWLHEQVSPEGIFLVQRTNRWSLPYQTFADSVSAYAWRDGTPADASRPHSYIEAQAYAADALMDAVRLLHGHERIEIWKNTAKKLQKALFAEFWDEHRALFAPALFEKNSELKRLDSDMIMPYWTLNVSFWEDVPELNRKAYIIAMTRRLFEDDFLTDVGIRTRSKRTHEPLGLDIDYHGSRTVWPMFNFMVIEGLRRHGLYRLARQLEYRVLNGINAIGSFPEFIIVDHEGIVYQPSKMANKYARGQMIPEQNIAFTVVPAMTLAYRHLYPRHQVAESGWRYQLETSILGEIPHVDLLEPAQAADVLQPTPLKITRALSGLRSARHIAPVILKRPR